MNILLVHAPVARRSCKHALARAFRPMMAFGFLLLGSWFAMAQKADATAAPQPSRPEVAMAFWMPEKDLQVSGAKYRVFYTMTETKTIPLQDYDFAANLKDELQSVLSRDTRATWRVAKPEEEAYFMPYFNVPNTLFPFNKNADRITLPDSVRCDRIVLAYVSNALSAGSNPSLHLTVHVRMVNRGTGKKLWEKYFFESRKLEGTKIEDLLADNQRALKVNFNKLMESTVIKVCASITKEKL